MTAKGTHSTGTLIVAGIAGLLIGAALASTVTYKVLSQQFNEGIDKVTATAKAKLAESDAQFTELAGKAKALAQRDLPLRVRFRKAFVGTGSVAVIQNYGGTELALKVTATSAGTNQTKEWRIVLEPDRTQDIGPREGWAWASGDVLEMSEEGYRPARYTLN